MQTVSTNQPKHNYAMNNKVYHVSQEFEAVCQLLDLDPNEVLRQAGLQHLLGSDNSLFGTPKQLSAIFYAALTLYGKDDVHLKLADGFAKGAFGHAFLAMQCSETLSEGLHRAARFKELVEPVKWEIIESDQTLSLSIRELNPDWPINGLVQVMCFVWLVQICRNITGKHIVPRRVSITDVVPRHAEVEEAIGCPVAVNGQCLLEFSLSDMQTRILSANRHTITALDLAATAVESERSTDSQFTSLVYATVIELLPSGAVTADRVAKHFFIGKRTLERRLSDQGTSFTAVVSDCRHRMTDHYLSHTKLPIAEIAYLVGYSEPSSFYRAYKRWSGRTIQEVSAQRLN